MQTLKINPEFKGFIPALLPDEYSKLEESILAEGCRDAIVTWQGVIVDGHNRYEICQRHGISFDTVEREFSGDDEAKLWIIKNQLARRNVLPYIRTKLALELEPVIAEMAKENQEAAGGDKKSEMAKSLPSNSTGAISNPIETRQEVAKLANVGPEYVTKVKTIERDGTPEIKRACSTGEMSAHQGYQEIKKAKKAEQQREAYEKRVEEAAKQVKIVESQPAVKVRPNLVLADPPWRYDFSETDSRKVENQYNTATVEEMAEHLPETQEDCVLLLWATAPKLLEAIRLIDLWGFTYKTHAIWDKEKIGMGYWFRGQHELLIVATKGNASPPMPDFRVSSVFREERGAHSKKPECAYQWIEQAFADRVKLEMYCREARAGWMVWGNEV